MSVKDKEEGGVIAGEREETGCKSLSLKSLDLGSIGRLVVFVYACACVFVPQIVNFCSNAMPNCSLWISLQKTHLKPPQIFGFCLLLQQRQVQNREFAFFLVNIL